MSARDSLRREAMDRAARARIRPEIMEQALLTQREGRPYVVELEDAPGRSFYRPALEGGSRILYLNIAHPFFTDVYAADASTRGFRDAIEVFLWVLALAELDGSDADRALYERERYEWSRRLGDALPALARIWGDL
jgi:hypothetical protein